MHIRADHQRLSVAQPDWNDTRGYRLNTDVCKVRRFINVDDNSTTNVRIRDALPLLFRLEHDADNVVSAITCQFVMMSPWGVSNDPVPRPSFVATKTTKCRRRLPEELNRLSSAEAAGHVRLQPS